MVATFSYKVGEPTEALNLPVQDYLNDILETLKDNEEHLISPFNLRNTFLSLWTSVPFKETKTTPTIDYIGVDSLNPIDRDLKRTIFIGKRSYLSNDIMNEDLLLSDTDIFLYNTKPDTISNNRTRISFLCGEKPTSNIAYIQSEVINNNKISFDIVSNGLLSLNAKNVNINGITISTIPTNNDTLMFENGEVKWKKLTLDVSDYIGTTGSEINFNGKVYVNDFPLEFTNTDYVPIDLGGIKKGEKLENKSLEDILRNIIYPDLLPLVTLDIDKKYLEIGSFETPILSWSITKRTHSIYPFGLINMIPGSQPGISGIGQISKSGIASGIVKTPINENEQIFTINVKDSSNNIISLSQSVRGVYPFFYGVSDLDDITNIELFNLNKYVSTKEDIIIDFFGDGNLYFIYDYTYGVLEGVYDDYNVNYISNFTFSYRALSYGSKWKNKLYYIYKWEGVNQPLPSIKYTFKY